MISYQKENQEVDLKITDIKESIFNTNKQIDYIRDVLYQDLDKPKTELPPSIISLEEKLKKLELEKIKASANYPSDWTSLLMKRVFDHITKEKFIKCREEAIPNMKTGKP